MSTVNTPVFRASFPALFKPRLNKLNGKEAFSVMALFPKGADLTVLKNAYKAACVKRWGESEAKWPKNLRSPFKDQQDREKDGKLPEGFESGAIYMTFSSPNKPAVVDQNVEHIIDQNKVYAGCYLIANVSAYAYDANGNRGVSFGLNHVQLVKDGVPLSGRPTVESAFKPVQASTADDIFG